MNFAAITLAQLEALDTAGLDRLDFGVVGLDEAGTVVRYNLTESRNAVLAQERVIGRPFFEDIGICMNNFMVAQRFEDEAQIDDTIDYVLTFRMRPTNVKLRLLKNSTCANRYLLIER